MSQPKGFKSKLILGAAWTLSTRWSMKCLGLINTIIVARYLLPSDYGVVAMAMLVVGLIESLLDFGAATALLRKAEVTIDYINSAWTLRVLEACLVGLLLLAVSPLAAIYFNEPRVTGVLWILAGCVVVGGATNIGLILAQKQFDFPLDFRLQLICKAIGVLCTVIAAHYLKDYRALVIGVAAGYVSGFILSYVLHPYRPSWNTRKIPEIWALTKWMLMTGIANFVLRKSDELIAARVGSTTEFGVYNVGSDLGQLPTSEVGPAMLKAFLPVLASMKAGEKQLNASVINTLSAVKAPTDRGVMNSVAALVMTARTVKFRSRKRRIRSRHL